jgi:hypothetical protein
MGDLLLLFKVASYKSSDITFAFRYAHYVAYVDLELATGSIIGDTAPAV